MNINTSNHNHSLTATVAHHKQPQQQQQAGYLHTCSRSTVARYPHRPQSSTLRLVRAYVYECIRICVSVMCRSVHVYAITYTLPSRIRKRCAHLCMTFVPRTKPLMADSHEFPMNVCIWLIIDCMLKVCLIMTLSTFTTVSNVHAYAHMCSTHSTAAPHATTAST